MSNFVSYNTYQPPEESQEHYNSPAVQHTGGTISVSVRDGETVTEVRGTQSFQSSDLTPFSADDWQSTALNPVSRSPAMEITADTLVTLYGQQGRVRDFVRAGVLQETQGGFEMVTEELGYPQGSEQATDQPDAASFPQELAGAIDAALEPFDQHTLDSGLGLAISSVTGAVDFNSVVRNVASSSGLDPKDAKQRVQFVMDAYQVQADNYVTKSGIDEADLGDFYAFCQSNGRELTTALQRQLYQRDMSGWKGLIGKFQSSTAPSLRVLQENGFQTRTLGNEAEVRIGGIWTSVKAAAKAGLI